MSRLSTTTSLPAGRKLTYSPFEKTPTTSSPDNSPVKEIAFEPKFLEQDSCLTFCSHKVDAMEKYTEVAREKHGPEFDVMNAPLDLDVVYKVGCSKKHGRHCLANDYIDSRISASQSRSSMSCGSVEGIRPPRRLRTAMDRIGDLESKIDRIGDLESKMEQMYHMLVTLTQNQNPMANNVKAPVATPTGTPGTRFYGKQCKRCQFQ